jgi:hypothetical protein
MRFNAIWESAFGMRIRYMGFLDRRCGRNHYVLIRGEL